MSALSVAVPAATQTAPPAQRRRLLHGQLLDLVCLLAQSGSLRAAAQRTGLSQPALSRQLKTLEQRLGTTVVERSPSGVRLTEAGERVLALAQSTRRLEDQLVHELQAGRALLHGQVRICGFSSVQRSVVLPALVPLLREHPGLSLTLSTEELYLIPSRGVAGEADLFLTQVPVRLDGYQYWILGHELNLLVESAMLPTPPHVYIDHEADDHFSEHYLSTAGQAGPRKRIFLGDIYGLMEGAAAGLGRAVVPHHLVAQRADLRRVAGSAALRVPVVLNMRTALLDIAAVRRVVDMLRQRAPLFLPLPAADLPVIDAAFAGPLHRFGS